MSVPRWQDSAVTLLTGKVLVVGGALRERRHCMANAQVADLFDPATNMFTPRRASSPRRATTRARCSWPTAACSSRRRTTRASRSTIPTTDTFTQVAHAQLHIFGFMVRLRDGRVLLGGGDGGTTAAELFDPDTNTFAARRRRSTQGRSMLTAHTLPDGRVLVIGGASMSAGGITVRSRPIEIFDPATNSFTAPRRTAWPRRAPGTRARSCATGPSWSMGGYTVDRPCDSSVASVEQIDPVAGDGDRRSPTLPNTNTEWTAVTLLDGSVLGVGGGACGTSDGAARHRLFGRHADPVA